MAPARGASGRGPTPRGASLTDPSAGHMHYRTLLSGRRKGPTVQHRGTRAPRPATILLGADSDGVDPLPSVATAVRQLGVLGHGLAALAVGLDVVHRAVLEGVDLVPAQPAGLVRLVQLLAE